MRRMQQTSSSGLPFLKMHGLGNDFVVIDARDRPVDLSPDLVRALGDRHRGVGFDQLAVITDGRDLTLTFYNADGSMSAACGNATRCVAAREMGLSGAHELTLDVTGRGALHAVTSDQGVTSVNMGHPQLDWSDIPLARDVDTGALPIDGAPVATGMGNPHCTFFVDDVAAVVLGAFGPPPPLPPGGALCIMTVMLLVLSIYSSDHEY